MDSKSKVQCWGYYCWDDGMDYEIAQVLPYSYRDQVSERVRPLATNKEADWVVTKVIASSGDGEFDQPGYVDLLLKQSLTNPDLWKPMLKADVPLFLLNRLNQ